MASVLTFRRKMTYAELASWPEDGRRYELYDGEVSELPAPLPRHQLAMFELGLQLRNYCKAHGGLTLVSPIDIVFDETNVLQPDIVAFTAERRSLVKIDEAIRVPPDVAVEVISPSTARNDRGRKLIWYERFGVAEYWVFDPVDERIEVRARHDENYVVVATAGRGEVVTSSVLPDFKCAIDSLVQW